MKWIKRLIITFVILVLLLIIAAVVFIRQFDVADYKNDIEQEISSQIGRDVTIEDIHLTISLKEGINLRLEGLNIVEEPARENDYMVRVGSASLGVDVQAFLKSRTLKVNEAILKEPEVYIVRDADGTMNYDDILFSASKRSVIKQASKAEKPNRSESSDDKKQALDLVISGIAVNNARVVYMDNVETEKSIEIHSFDFLVDNFALNQDFDFESAFGILSDQQNVLIKGSAAINPKGEEFILRKAELSTDLNRIEIVKLSKLLSSNEQLNNIKELKGKLQVRVDEVKLSKNAAIDAGLDMDLEDGYVQLAGADKPFEQIRLIGRLDSSKLTIESLSFKYGQGEGEVQGQAENYLMAPYFEFSVWLKDFLAGEVLGAFDLPVNIDGKINGTVKGNAAGLSPEAIKSSLNSDGEINLTDGLIRDVNVLKLVLSKLSFIPDLVSKIEEKLPPEYKEKLKAKDTILNLVESDISVGTEKLYFKNTKVDADGFMLTMNGDVNFDQYLNLNANFSIPVELSQIMVASAPDLKALLGQDNVIRIPFKPYSGKLDKFIIYPDIGDMVQKYINFRGRDELQKVIFKALDLDEEPQPKKDGTAEPAVSASEQPPESETKAPEQQLIEGILDSIFK